MVQESHAIYIDGDLLVNVVKMLSHAIEVYGDGAYIKIDEPEGGSSIAISREETDLEYEDRLQRDAEYERRERALYEELHQKYSVSE